LIVCLDSFPDIDECMNVTVASSICGIATNSCINKPGSYECTCNTGYQFNATTKQCEGEIFERRGDW